jgi:myo-inositol-1(or 4)-monophosphatase
LISTGFPYRPGDKLKQHLSMLGEIISQTAAVRRPGAAALDLAYVAAGFSDGFFESGLQPWDVAAGSLLVTEAGGLVGNYTGESEFLHENECVAANPRIYGQMVATLAKYSKFEAAPKPKKTSVGRPVVDTPEKLHDDPTVEAAFAASKPTLTAKPRRIKTTPSAAAPDAPF